MKTSSIYHQKAHLSLREREVIQLIAAEYSTQEIADRLFLSFETIKSHRKSIMTKLGVRNVAGLVREAFLQNIVSCDSFLRLEYKSA